MTDAFTQVNWIAVLLSLVAAAVLGGLYFGVVAAKQYLVVMELDELPKGGVIEAVGPLACMLLNILASAVLVAALDLTTAGDAVVFGLVTGIGYLVAMTFQIAINPRFPHPIRYGLLNAPFFLAVSLVTSLLLVLV